MKIRFLNVMIFPKCSLLKWTLKISGTQKENVDNSEFFILEQELLRWGDIMI